ncbi:MULTISPECIES: hypothetical protein [unclassified Caballeronia]|uniref:hypothetical protein n=1 Tax=unclassified Caballeronia TaxID=2646786 RepID=UPI002028F9CE|nr:MULTISPECIES: hypothetical protein [unclassified Caballeronia]
MNTDIVSHTTITLALAEALNSPAVNQPKPNLAPAVQPALTPRSAATTANACKPRVPMTGDLTQRLAVAPWGKDGVGLDVTFRRHLFGGMSDDTKDSIVAQLRQVDLKALSSDALKQRGDAACEIASAIRFVLPKGCLSRRHSNSREVRDLLFEFGVRCRAELESRPQPRIANLSPTPSESATFPRLLLTAGRIVGNEFIPRGTGRPIKTPMTRNGLRAGSDASRQNLYYNGEHVAIKCKGKFFQSTPSASGHDLFTGIAPSEDGQALCAYKNGEKLDLLPERAEDFHFKQGRIGDCYLLSTLKAAIDQPLLDKLKQSTHLRADGSLEIELHHPAAHKGLHEGILSYMKDHGYHVTQGLNILNVTVSREKLQEILDEKKSVSSSSLYLHVMEHVVGNLLKQENSKTRGILMNSIEVAGAGGCIREDEIVVSLLGKKLEPLNKPYLEMTPEDKILEIKKQRLLKNDASYTVAMYTKDAGHVWVLKDVICNTDRVLALELINPHDTTKVETFKWDDINKRPDESKSFRWPTIYALKPAA